MTKNKSVLPNLTWQRMPVFDPNTISAAPATQPEPEAIPTPEAIAPAVDEVPASPPPKRRPTPAKKNPMRQRGLHLEDGTILNLRMEALRRGITASRLANQIIQKALAS